MQTGKNVGRPAANQVEQMQRDFERMMPQMRSVARHHYRRAKCAGIVAKRCRLSMFDFVHEVITICWRDYQRLLTTGREGSAFATPLATYASLQVLAGRSICGCGNRDALNHAITAGIAGTDFDTADRICHQQGSAPVESRAPEELRASVVWILFLIPSSRSNPADNAGMRHDFAYFLESLTPRLRAIACALAAGYSTHFVARMFNLTPGRISQMRSKLRDIWNDLN